MKSEKPIKDKGCIKCEYVLECEGKVPRVQECLKFKERREEQTRWQRRW